MTRFGMRGAGWVWDGRVTGGPVGEPARTRPPRAPDRLSGPIVDRGGAVLSSEPDQLPMSGDRSVRPRAWAAIEFVRNFSAW